VEKVGKWESGMLQNAHDIAPVTIAGMDEDEF
jgi:hypothetical protein